MFQIVMVGKLKRFSAFNLAQLGPVDPIWQWVLILNIHVQGIDVTKALIVDPSGLEDCPGIDFVEKFFVAKTLKNTGINFTTLKNTGIARPVSKYHKAY